MNARLLAVLAAVGLAFLGGWLAGRSGGATTAWPAGKQSLVAFTHGEPQPSDKARQAARAVLRATQGDVAACAEALAIYEEIEPIENFGREYPSLRWTCEYLLADDAGRAARLQDPDAARFVRLLEPNGWLGLRNWLTTRYELDGGGGMFASPPMFGQPMGQPMGLLGGPAGLGSGASFRWVDEFVRFNSPGRAAWEHSDALVALVDPKPGQAVADIGSGPGFYAFRFAPKVGAGGKVYAVELDERHLAWLQQVKQEEGLAQLEVVRGDVASVGLPADSLDVAFLCATYQAVYGSTRQADREAWLASLKAALRPGGRVVIAENVPDGELPPGVLPDGGFAVSRALVVAQMEAYGFRLVGGDQFIPQRYVVVFEEG